jgi:phospholipase C
VSRMRNSVVPRLKAFTGLLVSASLLTCPGSFAADKDTDDFHSKTRIKHIVVIFQENVSFDHYFGTYPHAANPGGTEPNFKAADDTPSVNGLTDGLLNNNPNSFAPFRLDPAQNYTCDQDHDYTDEQTAFDHGLMDLFPETVGNPNGINCLPKGQTVMGYYDGNTVTGLWNYAQHFALNDNSFNTTFGPSTPGVLNLVSGNTFPVVAHAGTLVDGANGHVITAGPGTTVIGDPDPLYDDCSTSTGARVGVGGINVGNLLNNNGITWGWFQGGFKPTSAAGVTPAVCALKTPTIGNGLQTAYSPHHNPFQYYLSTSNPHHLPATSVAMIGKTDQANHQYDLADFWAAVNGGNMPAVSFLKAWRAQDGHANNSSPLDEQLFLVDVINRLQQTKEWKETAVIISWDDSDGWYDHVIGPILNQSATIADSLSGPSSCGTSAKSLNGIQGRCGYGPRLPLLVVSPFAKKNFVDNTVTDQSSILRLIEDNFNLGRVGGGSFDAVAGSLRKMFDFDDEPRGGKVFLKCATGEVTEEAETCNTY